MYQKSRVPVFLACLVFLVEFHLDVVRMPGDDSVMPCIPV